MDLRFKAEIRMPDFAELFDVTIPEKKSRFGRDSTRFWHSSHMTPHGLPLEFALHFGGDIGELRITTAGYDVLNIGGIKTGCTVNLHLPTEEELSIFLLEIRKT